MNEGAVNRVQRAVEDLVAAAEATRWDDVANIAGAIRNEAAGEEELHREGINHDFGTEIEHLARAARHALASGSAALARKLLDLLIDDWRALDNLKEALCALETGDAELALALEETSVVEGLEKQALRAAIREHTASILSRGSWEQRVLARARGVPRDAGSRAFALVRMCERRRSGPDAKAFERCAARYGLSIAYVPALFDFAWSCSLRRAADRPSFDDFLHYACLGLAQGRDEEVNAKLEELITTSPSKAPFFRQGLDAARGTVAAADEHGCVRDAFRERRSGNAADPTERDVAPRVLIGEFEVESATLRLVDPAIEEPKPIFSALVHPVKLGKWRAETVQARSGVVAGLVVHHVDYACSLEGAWARGSSGAVGVDSGRAGIYDAYHYRDDEHGATRFGCTTTSGHGDGAYDYMITTDDGIVVGVAIDFCMAEVL